MVALLIVPVRKAAERVLAVHAVKPLIRLVLRRLSFADLSDPIPHAAQQRNVVHVPGMAMQYDVRLVFQGDIVAGKTVDYLERHPEMEVRLSKNGKCSFLTTDTAKFFEKGAFLFGMSDISAESLTF